ncbi:stage II sporulation protein M [Paludicola sp. MB14-C6]|uniref:stage II sporulation protein M n=1 Tax=Paludihabitans sp. MB14-C6 TaxID=3070656 RepID=UPI0027DB7715|nr:stage II sporulation protein M [Paludicola sp. MB14-C6]WMJ23127.1 stage II sporulation protein M [Paludicola sp. MB14-C6]
MRRTSFHDHSLGHDNSIGKNNYIFLAIILLFIVGMIYGTLLIKSQSGSLLKQLNIITKEYVGSHRTQSIISLMINSFLSSALFLVIPYLLGYSAIGQAGTLFVPLFKGLGLGATLGNLYLTYGLKGIGYSALIIVPQTAIALFAIIIGCRESIKLSNMFFISILPDREKMVTSSTVKMYNIKFLILLSFIVLSALVDATFVALFSGIFQIY